MKKVLVALFLITSLVLVGGVVGAEEAADDPVSSEVGGDVVDEEKPGEAVAEEPVADGEKEAVDEEIDYVRPDVEGEMGITAIGIELEEGADLVATGIEDDGQRSTWLYGGAAAALVLLIAALALRRRKASA